MKKAFLLLLIPLVFLRGVCAFDAARYKNMLSEINPDYFPPALEGDIYSFDVELLGALETSYGKVEVLRSEVVWGASYKMTSRIVFFVDGKPYGEFYEFVTELMSMDGSVLSTGDWNCDLKDGIPERYATGPLEFNLEKF